jgi:hypothetical protein
MLIFAFMSMGLPQQKSLGLSPLTYLVATLTLA